MGSATTMLPAEGFSMKGTHPPIAAAYDSQNFVFIGLPHNGDFELPLSSGNWYLTGNPYPSAMDNDQFILDNQGVITGEIEIWDDWSDNTHYYALAHAGYGTYNLSGGAPAPNYNNTSELGAKIPGRYMPVAQGFGVTGAGPVGSMIKFNNAQREFVTEADPDESLFFKQRGKTQRKNQVSDTDARLKIRLGFTATSNFNRQILLTFDDKSTDGLDYGYDAISNNVFEEDMYWMLEENKLIIQAVKDLRLDRVVPLGIKSLGEGPVKIKVDAVENPTPGLEVYLRDNLTMDTHDILNGTFEINLAEGAFNEQYSVVFEPKPEAPEEVEEMFDELLVFVSEDNNFIRIKRPDEMTIQTISLFNVIGQQIRAWSSNLEQREIDLAVQVETGVYVVMLETDQGNLMKKVVMRKNLE